MKAGLYLYFGKINVHGLENVPKNAPVLFLPNHQSALLDVLLIAVHCNSKPYFLTRSDVFKGSFLKAVFDFFRMIPIYRIRDGRASLKYSQVVFDRCADLFKNQHAILMFPEADHNLKRRVRPLSKGFTRILFNALAKHAALDIHIVPIGLNYRDAVSFPDKVALYFGGAISTRALYTSDDVKTSVNRVKNEVSKRLQSLTTHIPDEVNYKGISDQLDVLQVDYLKPKTVNKMIPNLPIDSRHPSTKKRKGVAFSKVLKPIFVLTNFPMVLIWSKAIKPKVWEPEFMGTLRFAFALLTYPIYYSVLFITIALLANVLIASAVIVVLFLFNWLYVRLS